MDQLTNHSDTRAHQIASFAVSGEFQTNVASLCVAFGGSGGLQYVLSDLQGSARVTMNNNVSSSTPVARHDYLPFGEEIGAGLGLRTTGQGYNASDPNRWKYAMTERDATTGLDHTWFRKYESMAGRWTSPDPLRGRIHDPQSLNGYSYTRNDPVNLVDPTGLSDYGLGPPPAVPILVPPPGPLDVITTNTWASLNGVEVAEGEMRRNVDFAELKNTPQNPGVGTPQDLRNSIYSDKTLLAKINGCIKSLLQKKLGKNWRQAYDRVGEQNIGNAPKIDARLTSQQIDDKYTHTGKQPLGTGVGGLGPHGTIFISSEGFNNPDYWRVGTVQAWPGRTPLQNAHIHELGNLISYYASNGTTYDLFGVKRAVVDDDSGFALQSCVFNEPIQMKGK